MRMVTICHVSNNYKPYIGGVARALEMWQKILHANNHSSTLITLDFLGEQQIPEDHVVRIPSCMRFTYKKIPIAVPWFPQRHIFDTIVRLKPDIVHLHHPFLLGPIALKVARVLRIPVVFTYHSQYEHYLHNMVPIRSTLLCSSVQYIVKNFCNRVDSIIAPSQTIKEQLITQCVAQPISVVPSPIEDCFFVRKKKQRTPKFKLISVSRFSYEKNIPFLLRVIKYLNPHYFQLTLVGYGAGIDFLQQYAYNALSLDRETVRFIVNPSRDELVSQYAAADLFIFASIGETQGLVLAESMATGTPVIARYGAGSSDIIKQGINGYLVHNEIEMKKKIEHLSCNPALLEHLRHAAYKTGDSYRAAHLIGSLQDFYNQVLLVNRKI
jgi:1,2-diacylglycerol 3-alpha-glucosyltransferase